MASTALKAPATLDEFLDWEDEQPERYEFLDGARPDDDRRHRGPRPAERQPHPPAGQRAARRAVLGARLQPQGGEPGRQRLDVPGAVRALRPARGQADPDRGCGRRGRGALAAHRQGRSDPQAARLHDARRRCGWSSTCRRTSPGSTWCAARRTARFADEVVEGLDGVLELPEIGVRLAMAEIYEDTPRRVADRRDRAPRHDHLARRRGRPGEHRPAADFLRRHPTVVAGLADPRRDDPVVALARALARHGQPA